MKLQDLADEFRRVKGHKIVGVTITYAKELKRPAIFERVAYAYNPAEDTERVGVYIANAMDYIAFDTYELGHTNNLETLFISKHESFIYRELLGSVIENVKFHTVGE